tara:strand:- start:935 stop:1171 length:237 start_codon:yes stop_codon:yes gene_type:complete
MNGKIPSVERESFTGGLTGESAYQWACFLYEEADIVSDAINYNRFKDIAETLEPKEGVPQCAGFYCKDLEEAIKIWVK